MADPLRKFVQYNTLRKWTNSYRFEKLVTQTAKFAVNIYQDYFDAKVEARRAKLKSGSVAASSSLRSAHTTKATEDAYASRVLPFVDYFAVHLLHMVSTRLCSQVVFGGEAMAPAITCQPRFGMEGEGEGAESGSGGNGKSGGVGGAAHATRKQTRILLLVRQLWYPELMHASRMGHTMERHLLARATVWFPRRAHVGDVIAFTHPNPVDPEAPGGLLVRRVVALGGDMMEGSVGSSIGGVGDGDQGVDRHRDGDGGDAATDGDFVIPEGHAWVVADNEDVPLADAPDSRTFGPLPLSHVVGRVVYAMRCASDHGVVANSAAAAAVDQPVLQVELELERMAEELEDLTHGTRSYRRVETDQDGVWEEDDDGDYDEKGDEDDDGNYEEEWDLTLNSAWNDEKELEDEFRKAEEEEEASR
jgi:hypothetical protein